MNLFLIQKAVVNLFCFEVIVRNIMTYELQNNLISCINKYSHGNKSFLIVISHNQKTLQKA